MPAASDEGVYWYGTGGMGFFFLVGTGVADRGGRGGLALFLDNGESGINWAPTPEPACFLRPAKFKGLGTWVGVKH